MSETAELAAQDATGRAVAEAAAMAVPYKLAEAYARRDIDALLALFVASADVVWVGTGPDEKRTGSDELRHQFERNLAQSEIILFRFESVRASSSPSASAAWTTAEGTMAATVAGEKIEVPVRLTAVLLEDAGEWRIIQAHLSCPAAGQAEGESFPSLLEQMADAVRLERPNLLGHAAPDGTVTILFTDIENSTQATERLGDQVWMEVLREHNEIIRELAREYGGYEVKSQGDGFMLAFGSARRALLCAIEMQRAFARRNDLNPDQTLRLSIGLHTGEAIREADDFFGKNVILAARIADLAKGGEILVSRLVMALTESGGDIRFGDERRVELKGLQGLHRVFEVLWG